MLPTKRITIRLNGLRIKNSTEVKYLGVMMNEKRNHISFHHFQRARDTKVTDPLEIPALIGIIYLAGILKSAHRNIIELWDMKSGISFVSIYLTMNRTRFSFLMRCLRFDNI